MAFHLEFRYDYCILLLKVVSCGLMNICVYGGGMGHIIWVRTLTKMLPFMYHTKGFRYPVSFNPQNSFPRWVLVLYPLHREGTDVQRCEVVRLQSHNQVRPNSGLVGSRDHDLNYNVMLPVPSCLWIVHPGCTDLSTNQNWWGW